MEKNKNKFLMPEAVFVAFTNEDIVTTSQVTVPGSTVPEDEDPDQ